MGIWRNGNTVSPKVDGQSDWFLAWRIWGPVRHPPRGGHFVASYSYQFSICRWGLSVFVMLRVIAPHADACQTKCVSIVASVHCRVVSPLSRRVQFLQCVFTARPHMQYPAYPCRILCDWEAPNAALAAQPVSRTTDSASIVHFHCLSRFIPALVCPLSSADVNKRASFIAFIS